MRELESSLQEFGEFLLKAQLARPAAAPYFVRWVRRFLSRPASDEPLTDQVRGFCERLERNGGSEDWQVRQADQALRIYFVNFLKRTGSGRTGIGGRPARSSMNKRTSPLAALEQLRMRLRTRHYSYRTECTYADWVRRFLDYAAAAGGSPSSRGVGGGARLPDSPGSAPAGVGQYAESGVLRDSVPVPGGAGVERGGELLSRSRSQRVSDPPLRERAISQIETDTMGRVSSDRLEA